MQAQERRLGYRWRDQPVACPSPFPPLPKLSSCPGLPGLSPPRTQVVGKLRVRLSCLWPNRRHSASLPLLGERAKGAQVVGAVGLSMQASYASTVRAGLEHALACEPWNEVGGPRLLRSTPASAGGHKLPSCPGLLLAGGGACSDPLLTSSLPALPLLAPCPPQKALFKGYTAPALPKAAYVHGVDDKGHQGALARESRRIVLRCACWLARSCLCVSVSARVGGGVLLLQFRALDLHAASWRCSSPTPTLVQPCRWLDSTNPPISGPVALTVLDAER